MLFTIILYLSFSLQAAKADVPNANMQTYENQIIKSILDQNVYYVDMVKIAADKLSWEHFADVPCIQIDILKYLYLVPDELAAKAQKEIDDAVHDGTFGLRLTPSYLSAVNEKFALFDVEYPANLVFFEGYFHNSTIDAVADPAAFLDTPSELIYDITALDDIIALEVTDDVIFAKEMTFEGAPVGTAGKSRSRSVMKNPASYKQKIGLGPEIDVFNGSITQKQMSPPIKKKPVVEPRYLDGVLKQNLRFYKFARQFVLKAHNFREAFFNGSDNAKALSFYLLRKFVIKFDRKKLKKNLDLLLDLINTVQNKTPKEQKAAIQAFIEENKNLDMATYGMLSDFYVQAKAYVEKNPNSLQDVFHDVSSAAYLLKALHDTLEEIEVNEIDHTTTSEFPKVERHLQSVVPHYDNYSESVRGVSGRAAPTIAETKVIDIVLYTPRYDNTAGSAIDRITTATDTTGYTVNVTVVNAFTDGLSAYNTVKSALFERFAEGVINLPALTPSAEEEFHNIKKYIDNMRLRRKYCALSACNCSCICVDKTCEILPEQAVICPIVDNVYINYELNKLTDICAIINIVYGSGPPELYGHNAFMDCNTWDMLKNSTNNTVIYAVCAALLQDYHKAHEADFSFKEAICPGFAMKSGYSSYVTRAAMKTTRSNNETIAMKQIIGLTEAEAAEMDTADNKDDDAVADDETSDEEDESDDEDKKKKKTKYIIYGLLALVLIVFIVVIVGLFAM